MTESVLVQAVDHLVDGLVALAIIGALLLTFLRGLLAAEAFYTGVLGVGLGMGVYKRRRR